MLCQRPGCHSHERLDGRTPLDFPPRPDGQRPEDQRLRSWAHRYPKADAPERSEDYVPVAIGTPHEPVAVVERAAPPHTVYLLPAIQVLTPVSHLYGYRYSNSSQLLPCRLRIFVILKIAAHEEWPGLQGFLTN